MGLSFLAPLFLAGLAAVAVPVWVHLTARDRRDVMRFPSLRFLTRLPYRKVRRRRLRHPFLFALRTLALALLAVAFARPLVGSGAGGGAGAEAGRELVIALDVSYSMGYGDTWERALAAAGDALDALAPADRAALVTFAGQARVAGAPTGDVASLRAALGALAPGAGSTRFAPALRLADQLLLDSPLGEREVVLISDLQAAAWDRSADGRPLSPGVRLTAVDLSAAEVANVSVSGVDVRSAAGENGPQVLILARLVNHGGEPVRDLPVTLIVEGEDSAGAGVDLPPAGSETVRLGPIAQPPGLARSTVRIGGDRLDADNDFHLILAPAEPLPVLLIEAPGVRPEASLYLRQALTVSPGDAPPGDSTPGDDFAEAPAFAVRALLADGVAAEDFDGATVVILHDSPFPGGAAGRALADRVAAGVGLWVVLGGRSPAFDPDDAPALAPEVTALLPGGWREPVDRLDAGGVSLAGVDYDHPALAVFAGPDDGNLAGPRLYRYRPITVAGAGEPAGGGATIIARTIDGAVALAERRHGAGRVLLWGSPFDNRWSNLPVQPVFLPFVHQVCRYLGGERAIETWHEVGQVLDLRQKLAALEDPVAGIAILEAPSGLRREIDLGGEAPLATLGEAGFYEIRPPGLAPVPVAVNADRAESDLTPLDAAAFVAASTAALDPEAPPAVAARGLTRQDRERRQGTWRFLALAALLLLATESLWSNRRAQAHPAPAAGRAASSVERQGRR